MFDINYLFDSKKYNGVVILLDNNSNIVKVNDYFSSLQGYENDELEGKSILDFILPTDKSIFFDISYSTEPTKEFICQMYHKNGAFRFFSFTVVKFTDYSVLFGSPEKKEFMSYHYDNTKKPDINEDRIFTSFLDVTDLFNENKTMGKFIDIFPSDIWVKDRLGRYIYINKAFESHTGHSLADVKGKDDYQLFPKEIALEFLSSDKIAIKSKKKIDYTFEVKDENLLSWTSVSKIPLYNANGTYIGILGYSVDISEFKHVEIQQKSLVNDYRTCVNTFFDIAFSYSTKGVVGAILGNEITEANLNDYKIEIKKAFNISENNKVKEAVKNAKNKMLSTIELEVFSNKYNFSLIVVNKLQEYNIYVVGNRIEV